LPNDGTGWFGPDTTKGATSRGQYGSPYTETTGIQEAYIYSVAQASAEVNKFGSNVVAKIFVKGSFIISSTINVPAPTCSGFRVAYGLEGVGYGGSTLLFTAGDGIVLNSTYSWNGGFMNGVQLEIDNSGTATAAFSAPDGINGNVAPFSFIDCWISQDNTLTPNANIIYFPSSGFVFYFTNSVIATGVNMVNAQPTTYFQSCLIGGGGVEWKLSMGSIYFNNCWITSPINYLPVSGVGGTGIFISINNSNVNLSGSYFIDLSNNSNPVTIFLSNCGAGTSASGTTYIINGNSSSGTPQVSLINFSSNFSQIASGLGLRYPPTIHNSTPTMLGVGIRNPTVTPSVPASGTAQQNTNNYPVNVYINGGTITEIQITHHGTIRTVFSNSTGLGLSGQLYELSPTDSITIIYTAAPTWEWLSD
jgi:hypothetical protein